MDNNVNPVFNWAEQIRRCKGAVNNEWYAVSVGNLRNRLKVDNIGIGVAESFRIKKLGVWLNCRRAVGEEVELSCVWSVVGAACVTPEGSVEGDCGVFDVGYGFRVVCSPGFSVFKVECG